MSERQRVNELWSKTERDITKERVQITTERHMVKQRDRQNKTER